MCYRCRNILYVGSPTVKYSKSKKQRVKCEQSYIHFFVNNYQVINKSFTKIFSKMVYHNTHNVKVESIFTFIWMICKHPQERMNYKIKRFG